MKHLVRTLAVFVCAGVACSAYGQAERKVLFVTNNQGEPASVSAMSVNDDGTLALRGTFNGGPLPTACTLTAGGQFLIIVNGATSQSQPHMRALRVNRDGTLGTGLPSVPVGDGPLSVIATSKNVVLVASVNAKTLQSFRINSSQIIPVSTVQAGNFPTSVVASNDGRFAYAMGPNDTDDIIIFSIGMQGELTRVGQVDVPGNGAYAASMHPSGLNMYVSTGMSNSLLNYAIDPVTGLLTFVGTVATGGNSVVETAMDPSGRWIASAHVLSDTVRVSRLNSDRTVTPTNLSYLIRQDVRDIVTDGRMVYVTDETPLGGGQVGILSYRVNDDGSFSSLGPAVGSGSFRPQFMALWQPVARCLGDADVNGEVNFTDISAVLTSIGELGPMGDANGDGFVTFADVNAVLSNQGSCTR